MVERQEAAVEMCAAALQEAKAKVREAAASNAVC